MMAARPTKAIQRSKPRSARAIDAEGAHALIWGDHADIPGRRPLLLLHGLPQRPDVFEPLAGRLARLGIVPIAPYLYGHLHKRPRGTEGYQLARFLGNALAVADRLELKSFDVVGIGLGAAVGWMLTGRHPQRVRWLASIQFPHPAAAAAQGEWNVPLGIRQYPRNSLTLEHMSERQRRLRKALVRHLLIEQGLPRFHLELYVERLSAPGALEVALAWNACQPPQELPALKVPVLLVSNGGGHSAGPDRALQLVAPGLARQVMLEETRFPLESASTELAAVLEEHLPPL